MNWYETNSIPTFGRTLWVIGYSGVGKSTFARTLAEETESETVECGSFIRAMHPGETSVEVLTASSLALLENDHLYFAKKIKAKIDDVDEDGKRSIVVGCRNPSDFVHCFDPHHDAVVFLASPGLPKTVFEFEGITVIKKYIRYLQNIELVGEQQVVVLDKL